MVHNHLEHHCLFDCYNRYAAFKIRSRSNFKKLLDNIPDVLYDIKGIPLKNIKYFDRQYNGNICHWPKQDWNHDDFYKYIFI